MTSKSQVGLRCAVLGALIGCKGYATLNPSGGIRFCIYPEFVADPIMDVLAEVYINAPRPWLRRCEEASNVFDLV